MATPSEKSKTYVQRAENLDWSGIQSLWKEIQTGDATGWDEGKALEHLIVRGFKLSNLEVEYPFDVPPGGKPIEQIDGIIYLNELVFLIECKDKDSSDVEVIAKVRHQLSRRPPTTFGCIFVTGAFTSPALILADLTEPRRLLLWTKDDIEKAIDANNFKDALIRKYKDLCKFGLLDNSPFYKELEVQV
jgi:hypothetical protein